MSLPSPEPRHGSWKIRRRLLFAALIFCAVQISWILWSNKVGSLYEQALLAFIGAATAIINGYVFGAAWENNNQRMNENYGRVKREDYDDL
jgi:glucan phosphoethanolaminetransferase (alkaline phosphatase superfamily)